MSEDEGLRDVGESEERSDLPRIIIEDDRIIVEENDWVGRDEKSEDEKISDLDIDKLLEDGVVFFPNGDPDKLSNKSFVRDESELEDGVGGGEISNDEENFYDVQKSSDEFYGGSAYDEKKDEYEIGIGDVGEVEGVRLGDRSMLEVAGFRNFEKEKKREDRKREMFG